MSADQVQPQNHKTPSSGHSVLDYLAQLIGETPKVLLGEEGSQAGSSPILDASSSEKGTVPKRRGGYRFLGEIARGGMGVILKGHDNDLGRDVAVKVLHKELSARPEILHRFVEEAQIGGQLQHPGIVPVYEMGLTGDQRPYFTMKLVKGRTLAAFLAERQDARDMRRRLLDIFESVCQTMAYAHSRKVVHRDLKPANIMVGAFGEVQVVDWGLAKVLSRGGIADEKLQQRLQTNVSIIETVRSDPGSKGHSMVGSVLGTPAYMPPEQARGDVEKLDAASDVFSLGAILFEILTGLPPYTGSPEQLVEKAAAARLDEAFERLDECDADGELIDLVKAALAPAQSARPRSAQVLAERIHEYQTSVEERASAAQIEAAEARVHAVQERKARRLTLSLAGTVLASVLLGGGGWLFLSKQRTARSENLRAEVAAALNDATRLRGQQEWAEALAAAQRAEHLVQSEGFEGLREQVGTELQGIRSDMEASQQAAQRKEDNASLLSALADIRQPTANLQTGPGAPNVDSKELNAEFSATLAKFDLDPDQGTEEEAARTILDRDLGPELAGILDEWSLLRKGMGDVPGSRRLNRVSDLCDTDESRRKLRPAIFTSRLAELEALARSPESASWSALTLNLLGTTLAQLGNHRTAAEVLQRAAAEAPRDFSVRLNLARTCIKLMQANDFASGFKALRHYEAALLLRPSSAEVHLELGVMLVAMRDQKSGIELLQRANELRGGQDQRSLALLAVALANDAQLDAALETGRKVDVAHLQSPEVVDLLNAINPHYRRKFLKGVGLEDAAPTPNIPNVTTQARRPDNMKPQPHETIGLKASLRSSTFDHESSRHAVTRWQIRGAEESYATNPTLDIMSSAFLTELPLLRGMLQPSKEYYWRVSHADEFNIATEFSEETAFRTADFKLHASPVDLEEHFNRDVIANPGDRTGDFFDQSGCRLVAENFPDASSGLPAGRQIGPHLLENYSVNNCIQITPKANSTVRIKAPRGHHDTLSFLVASGDGNVQLPVRVEYADGSFELLTLWIPDWYQDTGDKTFPEHVTARWNGMNRFCLGAVEQVQDAALFEIHMNLKPDVQLKSIDLHATAATFTDPSARAHVFAITALKAED